MGQFGIVPSETNPLDFKYSQISTRFDPEYGVLWTQMNPVGIPCCSKELLEDLYHHHKTIENSGGKVQIGSQLHSVHFSVVSSLTPRVFNLGGDLRLFSALIKNKDRQALLKYSTLCLDLMFCRMNHFKSPLITISLVQGDALGGGLEAALTSDVIIAERGTKMGFPEMLFNLIPGHGAFSMVARKIGVNLAEKLILSGKVYPVEELHGLGLVDVLVEKGEGEEAIHDYVAKRSRNANGYMALQKAKQRFNPLTYQEMMDITNIWVDAALNLGEKDLKVMDRFARSQHKLFGNGELTEPVVETPLGEVSHSGEVEQKIVWTRRKIERRKAEISLVL
ncbi:MAG: crotonase/enoyl-CoA hydratase family protein [Nitrosomonadales bacterium]|nr:crotonase/enoyl-CoA hydratase family protein [Nitrosomonadales bacterium]